MRGFIAPKWSLVHTFLTTNRGSGKRAEVAIEEVCKPDLHFRASFDELLSI
jgi:hypothetical protein